MDDLQPADEDTFGRGPQLRTVLSSNARVRSIVGPGGMGKTTLARRLADLLGATGLPVVFCELSEARTLADCERIVGTAVGGRGDLGKRLGRRGELLLVLDNVEQLVDERLADRVGAWLGVAPWLRVLVTSRVVLGVPDESVLWLDGLATENAARLFVQRMPRAAPVDAAEVNAIVERLDGVPLAIELAAARTLLLSPKEILERLADGAGWLVSPRGGRHASMARVVEDSWGLLTTELKDALTSAMVFLAPFSARAFESVLGEPDALDRLDALVRASLLQRLPDTPSFRPLEPVREVLGPRLALHASVEIWRDRHAAWFGAIAAGPTPEARALTDLRAAAERTIAVGKVDEALVLAVEKILSSEGAVRDALTLVERALSNTPSTRLRLARARALRTLGRFDAARADADSARNDPDPELAASALVELAELADYDGDIATATTHLDAATALLGGATSAAFAELRLRQAHVWRRELRLELAMAAVDDALRTFAAHHLRERLALAQYEAAVIALLRRDLVTAEVGFETALQLAIAERAAAAEAIIRAGRALVWQERGRLEDAIGEYALAARLHHEVGHVYGEGSALYYLGAAYLEAGQLDQAARTFDQALTLVNEVNVPRYVTLIEGARSLIHRTRDEVDAANASLQRAREAFARCQRERQLATVLAWHEGTGPDAEVEATDDIRFAKRLALARRQGTWPPVPGDVLVVHAAGFRVPGARSDVSLASRPVLSRILGVLASRRATAPGRVVPFAELREAAWPGEHMSPRSAQNRMHVAMATLRKLGLRPWLERDAAGYLLSAAQAFRFDPA